MEFFVENNANIHTDDDRAFQYAAREGNLEVLKFLVDHVEKKEGPRSVQGMIHARGDLAFQWSTRFKNPELLNFLIKYVKENEGSESVKGMIHADNNEAIRFASLCGNLDGVRFIYEYIVFNEGENVAQEILHSNCDQIIAYAAQNNHPEVVEYLLTLGMSPEKIYRPSDEVKAIIDKYSDLRSSGEQEMNNIDGKCQARTLRGFNCKNKSVQGSKHCRIHKK